MKSQNRELKKRNGQGDNVIVQEVIDIIQVLHRKLAQRKKPERGTEHWSQKFWK